MSRLLAASGLTAKAVARPSGDALLAGDLVAGGTYQLIYQAGLDKFVVTDFWRRWVDLDNNTPSLTFTTPQTDVTVDLASYVPAGGKRARVLVRYDSSGAGAGTYWLQVWAKANGATDWADGQDGGYVSNNTFYHGQSLTVPVDSNRKIKFSCQFDGGSIVNGRLIVTWYEL